MKPYIPLEEIEVYRLARELSLMSWKIYQKMTRTHQILIGDQFVRSADSVGANIAEAYGRYSYLDRIRILYFSRGSFFECRKHWIELLKERNFVSEDDYTEFKRVTDKFELKLNLYIKSLKQLKRL